MTELSPSLKVVLFKVQMFVVIKSPQIIIIQAFILRFEYAIQILKLVHDIIIFDACSKLVAMVKFFKF